jgi:hypothetical protein
MQRIIYTKIHRDKKAADNHEKKIKDVGGEIVKRIDKPDHILIQYKFKLKKHEARLREREK